MNVLQASMVPTVHKASNQLLAGYPLRGKSSVSVICMKYRILIIIIVSVGQILLSYIANTSRTHARILADTHSPTHHHRRSGCYCSMGRWGPTVTELTSLRRFRWRSMVGHCFIQMQSRSSDSVFVIVVGVFSV